ncbi:MAG TPA: CsbD family protein [Microlunatus sp.]
MGIGDKAKNKATEVAGAAKEKAGEAMGDDELRREGKRDQAKANAKQAGEKVKDAADDLTGRDDQR